MATDEDVEMVANSAGVSEDEARQALEECKGNMDKAIERAIELFEEIK